MAVNRIQYMYMSCTYNSMHMYVQMSGKRINVFILHIEIFWTTLLTSEQLHKLLHISFLYRYLP